MYWLVGGRFPNVDVPSPVKSLKTPVLFPTVHAPWFSSADQQTACKTRVPAPLSNVYTYVQCVMVPLGVGVATTSIVTAAVSGSVPMTSVAIPAHDALNPGFGVASLFQVPRIVTGTGSSAAAGNTDAAIASEHTAQARRPLRVTARASTPMAVV